MKLTMSIYLSILIYISLYLYRYNLLYTEPCLIRCLPLKKKKSFLQTKNARFKTKERKIIEFILKIKMKCFSALGFSNYIKFKNLLLITWLTDVLFQSWL